MVKNNNKNNSDHHKIHKISVTNCFVLVITLIQKTVQSLALDQIATNLLEKILQLFPGNNYVSVGLTLKQFGHYVIFKSFSSRSPSYYKMRNNPGSLDRKEKHFLYAHFIFLKISIYLNEIKQITARQM